MKEMNSKISVVLFLISLITYIVFITGIDLVSDEFFFPILIVGSLIGFILSFFGKRDAFRRLGMFGNLFILLLVMVLPFIVTTFFWNTP